MPGGPGDGRASAHVQSPVHPADKKRGGASTVYVIGADRISTELYNVVDANLGPREPLQLSYEYNDPRDFNIADNEKSLVRDNLGPRAGKGFNGKIGGK